MKVQHFLALTYLRCPRGTIREKNLTKTPRVEPSGLRAISHLGGRSERPTPPRHQTDPLVPLPFAVETLRW